MTEPNPTPVVADEVPWSEGITEYDTRHEETYIRLLDADIEGLAKDEMARRILGIDPANEPERPRKAVESHLARALDDRGRLPPPGRRPLPGRGTRPGRHGPIALFSDTSA